MIEMDIGIDLGLQAVDQLFIAVLDRIQADIAVDVHDEVLQRIQPVGVVALGGEIGPRHHLEEAFCGGIVDFPVEQFLAGDVGPWMFVVVGADTFVVFDRRHHFGAALAKRFDRVRCPGAVFATHARHVVQKLAIEVNLLGIHRNGLQAEMLDQFAQRIRTGHRVIVKLGDAGFVHRGCAVELAGQDLAAETVGRLINGDAAKLAELLFEIPGAHQAAGPAANDCNIQHVSSVIPRRPSREHPV